MKLRIPGLLLLLILSASVSADITGLIFRLGPVLLENVTEAYQILRVTPTFGAAVFDFDRDSWPDLLISNHGKAPTVFLNQKGKLFQEHREILPLASADRHAPALADYDNDGDHDLFFQRGAHSGTGLGPKEFLINPGDGNPFVLVDQPVLEDSKGRGRTAVWFDYDADGFVDLLSVYTLRNDAPNRLFHNNGDGTFTDVSASSGLMLSLSSEGGAVAADFDDDGDMDVLMPTTGKRPYLFMNQGNGTFHDESLSRGIPQVPDTWAAGVADYDNDGAPDIYLSRGNDSGIAEGVVMSEHRINFMQIVNSQNDPVDQLTFFAEPEAVLQVMFSEKRVDEDHIYIGARGINPGTLEFQVGPGHISANGIPAQWKENGSALGTFVWRDPGTGVWTIAAGAGNSKLISGGLIETDSKMTSLTLVDMEPRVPKYPNLLLRNRGEGNFEDVTTETKTGNSYNSRSPLWVDLDNDADLDLFIVSAGFNGFGKQPHVCLINNDGVFDSYDLEQGPREKFGRGDGGLVADFNRDGFQDLFVINGSGLLPANRGPYQLFLNRTRNSNNWIGFRLIGGGKNYTNRDAIGAKIEVRISESDKSLWRTITGGSGSDCQSTRTLHFGLGSFTSVSARVFWPPSRKFPRGHTQDFSFSSTELNQRYTISEIAY